MIETILDLHIWDIEKGDEFFSSFDDIDALPLYIRESDGMLVDDMSYEILSGVIEVLKTTKFEITEENTWPGSDTNRIDVYIGDRYAPKSATFVVNDFANKNWQEHKYDLLEEYYPKYNEYCFRSTRVADAQKGYHFIDDTFIKDSIYNIAKQIAYRWVKRWYWFIDDKEIDDNFCFDSEYLPPITITVFSE